MRRVKKGNLNPGGIGLIAVLTAGMVLLGCGVVLAASDPPCQDLPQISQSTADHEKFDALNRPLTQGPDATKACLSCHTEAGKQVQRTIHWTWGKKKGGDKTIEKSIGKAYIINNF